MSTACGSKLSSYNAALELDKKIRDFPGATCAPSMRAKRGPERDTSYAEVAGLDAQGERFVSFPLSPFLSSSTV